LKVLVIEDSSRLRRSLCNGLQHEGFATDATGDGREGLSYAEVYTYDAIVLDIMLPSMDGLTILKTLRTQRDETHILILSAKDQLEDRLQGLDLGADDYLVKPFAFEELCSRLRALMRRRYQSKTPQVCLDGLVIDTAQRRAWLGEAPLQLTRQEYALLEQLALSRGRVLSRDLLRDQLYTSEADVASNVIDVVVCTLRRKIKSAGGPAVIQTIRGQGYLIS
jgi:DNA-binding response OmpR family regulator